MQLLNDAKKDFNQRATNSSFLEQRLAVNLHYSSGGFDAWVNDLLRTVHFSHVLDVCCGTGKQVTHYASLENVVSVIGVDISADGLKVAQQKLEGACADKVTFKCLAMEHMFDDVELASKKFDLISCFYGLYYAKNVEHILQQCLEHLNQRGNLLIVGPYGQNNKNLFDLLGQFFTLPALVTYSSQMFMEQEVLPILQRSCRVVASTFVNYIAYPTPQAVLDYWRSTTFYSAEHEPAVASVLEHYFLSHSSFVVEKHVLAYMAQIR